MYTESSFGAGWLLSTLITSYPTFLSVEEPRFVILRFDPINCPDSYGGGSIPAHASNLPLEENIAKTRAFVEEKGNELVIEGACDEIIDAGGESHNDITTADKCKDYVLRTGVDLVVANLGTEHRASGKELQYHGDAARAIKAEIGPIIVLHGTSSVSNEQAMTERSTGPGYFGNTYRRNRCCC